MEQCEHADHENVIAVTPGSTDTNVIPSDKENAACQPQIVAVLLSDTYVTMGLDARRSGCGGDEVFLLVTATASDQNIGPLDKAESVAFRVSSVHMSAAATSLLMIKQLAILAEHPRETKMDQIHLHYYHHHI